MASEESIYLCAVVYNITPISNGHSDQGFVGTGEIR